MAALPSHIPSFIPLVIILYMGVMAHEGVEGEEYSQYNSHLVKGLPGQPSVGFQHYAGYVRVRAEEEKALFYWFFEAEGEVDEKPLVLWLNGGPGCSSVSVGAATEIGPFLIRGSSLKPTLNPYSWNKVANLLFLESPVGVGFSYSNKTSELKTSWGDRVTAEDSHAFLLNWFQMYPRFKTRDFYLAGESYAGHYVPQLAELIYEGNKRGSKGAYINLKGFMVGNALIGSDDTNTRGMVDYAWSHAIISEEIYHSIIQNCINSSTTGRLTACAWASRAFSQAVSGIDPYSIFTPLCLKRSLPLLPHRYLSNHEMWQLWPLRVGYDPCTKDYAEKFFNREDVQEALHANITKLSYPYTFCNNDILGNWSDRAETVIPIVQKLMRVGLRVWVYSGDADMVVSVASTRYFLKEMRLKAKEEWRAWYHEKQVAGWVGMYEGLTFATVKGAGHEVPVLAPGQSLTLFSHFLAGKPLPSL